MSASDDQVPGKSGAARRPRAAADAGAAGVLGERATERIAQRARANLRNLVSDDTLALPSLSAIADDIRIELEKRGSVAILYVGLKRYGRLERVFGWQVTSEVLDACSSHPSGDGGHLAARASTCWPTSRCPTTPSSSCSRRRASPRRSRPRTSPRSAGACTSACSPCCSTTSRRACSTACTRSSRSPCCSPIPS